MEVCSGSVTQMAGAVFPIPLAQLYVSQQLSNGYLEVIGVNYEYLTNHNEHLLFCRQLTRQSEIFL